MSLERSRLALQPRRPTVAAESGSLWSWTRQAFFAESSTLFLLAAVAVPLAAAAWLLLAPATVFSREMTWDLSFNLAGAWNLWSGQALHVDFHDPLGVLTFGLTALGFQIVGLGPRAFLVGETIYAMLMLMAALSIFPRRLPLLPSAIATLYVVLLVLTPTNLGDPIQIYSFAMSYNRFGWSALVLLCSVLFLAPRRDGAGAALDRAVAFLLGSLLFYLKITYFGVGLGAIAAALVLSPHVRSRTAGWLGVLAALALLAAAPFNLPYWHYILAALQAGAIRQDILTQAKNMITSSDTVLVGIEVVCLLCLLRAGASVNRLAGAAFIIVSGAFVLSQNEQADGIALYVVVGLLLYDSLRAAFVGRLGWPAREAVLLLAAVLIAPGIKAGLMGASLVGYYAKASEIDDRDILVEDTNLRGLAVPAEHPNLIAAFSAPSLSPGLLNSARREHPRYELTQAEYVETTLEAAAIVRSIMTASPNSRAPHVGLLDAVNPLPFMLGLPAAPGGQLWLDRSFPWLPATEALGSLDYVFVPKFPTDSASTGTALDRYGSYLEQNFHCFDTDSWIVFARGDLRIRDDGNGGPVTADGSSACAAKLAGLGASP